MINERIDGLPYGRRAGRTKKQLDGKRNRSEGQTVDWVGGLWLDSRVRRTKERGPADGKTDVPRISDMHRR